MLVDQKSNQTHVFYVNTTDFLQEVISEDNLTTWKTGPLGNSSFAASISSITLNAFYSPNNLGNLGNSAGMRLYYGDADDNQIHELAYAFNDTQWTSQFSFPDTNGNGGFVSGLDNSNRRAQLISLNGVNDLTIWNNNLSVSGVANAKKLAYGLWVEGWSLQ